VLARALVHPLLRARVAGPCCANALTAAHPLLTLPCVQAERKKAGKTGAKMPVAAKHAGKGRT